MTGDSAVGHIQTFLEKSSDRWLLAVVHAARHNRAAAAPLVQPCGFQDRTVPHAGRCIKMKMGTIHSPCPYDAATRQRVTRRVSQGYLLPHPFVVEAFHAGPHPTTNCEPLFFRCN